MPAAPKGPVDPRRDGPRLALAGRVVTMDGQDAVPDHVVDDGVVYLAGSIIADVRQANDPRPEGFEATPVILTGGTIYPGLIELHNHLAYDALQLWRVPRRFTNRGQWVTVDDYYRLVQGPMQVLGKAPGLLPALVRYVEVKALAGGVTTSQGIELVHQSGIRRYYRGLVRNVEATGDPDLPAAVTRIADVEARDAAKFLTRLRGKKRLILHLAEGVDDTARRHFRSLRLDDGTWAITANLVGIHCGALRREDFDAMAANRGSMVWSPLSNLLLYGDTARVEDAKAAGVSIGLGSDWSPSGSKNLLSELKVARLVSDLRGGVFTSNELVAMATRDGATILGWDGMLGRITRGRRADLLVVRGAAGNPYDSLISATEADVRLVMVNGEPRIGAPDVMAALGINGEAVTVGGNRVLNLVQDEADPLVSDLTLANATSTLTDALAALGDPHLRAALLADAERSEGAEQLALDEFGGTGMELRPRLGFAGAPTGPQLADSEAARARPPLGPLQLDPLTASGDRDFAASLRAEQNLPPGFGERLAMLSA